MGTSGLRGMVSPHTIFGFCLKRSYLFELVWIGPDPSIENTAIIWMSSVLRHSLVGHREDHTDCTN